MIIILISMKKSILVTSPSSKPNIGGICDTDEMWIFDSRPAKPNPAGIVHLIQSATGRCHQGF